jgi:phosphocarrier protein HPr
MMINEEIEVVNKLGLHARASAKLTQLGGKYKSDIWMTRNGRRVNGKSIMGVMMLAAGKGTKVAFEVTGIDEQECFDAIATLFSEKFGEGE